MLGITRSKCGTTVSPRSRAAAGAAKAIAKAAPAARRADFDFHGGCSPYPRLVDLSLVQHEVPRTDKTCRLPVLMPKLPQLELDRRAKTPLAEQICNGIRNAIETGVLASGAR